MRKSTWIVAVSLIVAGILLCAVALFAIGFDFSKLDTNKYVSKTYNIEDEFFSLDVSLDTADIQFLPSGDGQCRVECVDMTENIPVTTEVREGKLYIIQEDHRAWYEHIGFINRSAKITVYLPYSGYKLELQGCTGDVNIPKELTFSTVKAEISTGDISFQAQVKGDLTLKTSTGSILCENVQNENISLQASTGDIRAVNLDCDEMNLRTSTGDVTFDNCNGKYLYITTDTGDVTGSFSQRMIFLCESNTGDIEVEHYDVGGKCEVKTDTGDITLSCE